MTMQDPNTAARILIFYIILKYSSLPTLVQCQSGTNALVEKIRHLFQTVNKFNDVKSTFKSNEGIFINKLVFFLLTAQCLSYLCYGVCKSTFQNEKKNRHCLRRV